MMTKYKIYLLREHEFPSEEVLHLVTASLFDALYFAGGFAVAQTLHNALAVMFGSKSPKGPDLQIGKISLHCLLRGPY